MTENDKEKNDKLFADQKKIEWLLFKYDANPADIAKNTTITSSAASNLKNGKSSIESMRFNNAASLTKYADELIEKMGIASFS